MNNLVPSRRFLIEVEPWGEKQVRVNCKLLNVSACAPTLMEALSDLCEHLDHFTEYYRRLSRSQCIGLAGRLRKHYLETFPWAQNEPEIEREVGV